MTRSSALVLALLVFAGRGVLTQSQPVHAPDGDSGVNNVYSIFVPPLRNVPFSATLSTEETRYIVGGMTVVTKNHRMIARDSLGRVFQERRNIAPEGSPAESQLMRTEIADPGTQTIAYCSPNQDVCELRSYTARTTWSLPPVGVSANGTSSLTREDLGRETAGGLEMVGTREVLTLGIGSDRPLSVSKEFWYSPYLGMNVSTRRRDQRIGRVEVFKVTDINLSEPDPNLFMLPTRAKIVDYRTPTTPR